MSDERLPPTSSPAPIDFATARHYPWGDGCDGWHLLATPELSVIRERMPSGTAEVRHRHARAQQFFFVLAGRLTIDLAGVERSLLPGQGQSIPAGVPHQVVNRDDSPAELLVVSQPPSHGDRIVDEDGAG